jgi:hypothetical protein
MRSQQGQCCWRKDTRVLFEGEGEGEGEGEKEKANEMEFRLILMFISSSSSFSKREVWASEWVIDLTPLFFVGLPSKFRQYIANYNS